MPDQPQPAPAPADTAYVVLQTIADGVAITDQPTAGRILHRTDHYADALEVTRANRVTRYRHRVTGEERDLTDAQTVACGFQDEELFTWIAGADMVKALSYAHVVELAELHQHEPNADQPSGA